MLAQLFNRIFLRGKFDSKLVKEIKRISNGRPVSIAFLTKPLQYMNLKGVKREKDFCKILIFSNNFADAENFVKYLQQKDTEWDLIYLVQTEQIGWGSILKSPAPQEYWTAWDCGVKCNFFMQELYAKGCKIKLIEEGYGNYAINPSILKIHHPWLLRHKFISKISFEFVREIFYQLSGSGNSLNKSKWVDQIYLYHPDYPSLACGDFLKLRKIDSSPVENFTSLCQYFDFSSHPWLDILKNQNVLIYATNWFDDSSFTQEDLKEYDFLITKYHPHLKDKVNKQEGQYIYMTGNIPIEVLIFKLLSQNCTITLRSAFSSSMFYLLTTSVKIEFLGGKIPDFLIPFYDYLSLSLSTSKE